MNEITEEEAQQYDRQIRLWGADAQRRLKNATVLIIGVNGVSCEVIKNIVLAGINTLALCDENNVTKEDMNINYLIDRAALNENRAKSVYQMAKNLNPRVNIETFDYMPLEISKAEGCTLSINNYDVIICCESSLNNYKQTNLWSDLNESCRQMNKLFFAMDSFGWHGFTFVDLGCHAYIKDEQVAQKDGDKPSTSDNKFIQQTKEFCSLNDVLSIDWSVGIPKSKLKRMPNTQFLLMVVQQFVAATGRYPSADSDCVSLLDRWHEFADRRGLPRALVSIEGLRECLGRGEMPVNAVLGGLVSQEIIKAISAKNEPFGNFILFNGVSAAADVTFLRP